MHPNAKFRDDSPGFHAALVDEVGFGMIFCETPDGPRVAHSPILAVGDGKFRFHLSRGNALAKHLSGRTALLVVNGPDAYVSARWYEDPNQVPTWNYVAAEVEGPVRELGQEALVSLLEALSERHEARIKEGEPWKMDKLSDKHREGLLGAIVGFELVAETRRETVKLSQNKSAEVRAPVIAGLKAQGDLAIAELMQGLAS